MMRLLRSYIFWNHERGSLHYDVMVTAILLFIFVSPRFIDFKDRPAPPVALRGHEVLVKPAQAGDSPGQLIYEVRAEDLAGASDDAQIRASLVRLIEPISGEVTLLSYTPVLDVHGHVAAYDARVAR